MEWLATTGIVVIIIAACIFNGWNFFWAWKRIDELKKLVHPETDRRVGILAELSVTDEECQRLNNAMDKAAFSYSLYSNITALFPFLGILGTVSSLMLTADIENLTKSFDSALLTTLLGLICAIVFKVLDSFISPKLDRAVEEADYVIHQHDIEKHDNAVREEALRGAAEKTERREKRDNAKARLSKDGGEKR